MLTQIYIHLGVALAGLVSFLSPCVLPLVPPYLGYLGGTTIEEMTGSDQVDARLWRRVVLASLCFVLGFTTVFVALGAGASVCISWAWCAFRCSTETRDCTPTWNAPAWRVPM
jgi:cytochrome c-type biogenesis protein